MKKLGLLGVSCLVAVGWLQSLSAGEVYLFREPPSVDELSRLISGAPARKTRSLTNNPTFEVYQTDEEGASSPAPSTVAKGGAALSLEEMAQVTSVDQLNTPASSDEQPGPTKTRALRLTGAAQPTASAAPPPPTVPAAAPAPPVTTSQQPASYQPAATNQQRPADPATAPAAASSAKKVHFAFLLPFDFGSAEIKEESKKFLDQVGGLMQKEQTAILEIIGHTDSVGSVEANKRLSLHRAESVKEYLVSHFEVGQGRLRTIGEGPFKPLDKNDTANPVNRRVQFAAIK
ncbi:MAG: OmpA family protein [Magnetococcales bacterium]|nr:OmpA family protein [Magnetococcales bacterium]